MRKKIVIFSTLILCCASVFAQNKMDKATFEHLVDYANCQYLMAFIEKNDVGKPYIKDTYEKNIKPVLQTATLDDLNNIPKIETIKRLFQNNSNNAALQLAEKINERKAKYDNSIDDNALIKSLTAESWKNVDLTSTATKVQNAVRKKYNLGTVSQQEIVNDKSIETSGKVDELQEKNQTLQQRVESLEQQIQIQKHGNQLKKHSHSMLWFALIATWIIMVALFLFRKKIFKLQDSKTEKDIDREKLITTILESGRIKRQFVSNSKLQNVEEKISELNTAITNIQTHINGGNNSGNGSPKPASIPDSPKPTKNDNGLYFASKSNKQLTEQQPNSANASFKVFAENGNEAKFEYIGVVRNENWFEGVCTIKNSANDNLSDKKQINTMHPGKVEKENNNWVVTTPAKIKFV